MARGRFGLTELVSAVAALAMLLGCGSSSPHDPVGTGGRSDAVAGAAGRTVVSGGGSLVSPGGVAGASMAAAAGTSVAGAGVAAGGIANTAGTSASSGGYSVAGGLATGGATAGGGTLGGSGGGSVAGGGVVDAGAAATGGSSLATGGASSVSGSPATGGMPATAGASSAPKSGVVQKGPFIRGTTVTLQELDASLNPTGKSFSLETNDDLGHFNIPANASSTFVEVIANGYYFDELANQLSGSQLTLRTISDLSVTGSINVNLLTSLAASRERVLVATGQSFQSARNQAEHEVLVALSFSATNSATFDHMDVSQAGDDNGLLLAASVLLEKLAYLRGATTPVAQLSQLLANIASDIAPDGSYDDGTTASTLRCIVPPQIDKISVRSNLQGRFAALGASSVVPAFEQFILVPASCCTTYLRQCSGNVAQVCDEVGRWATATTCSGATPACKDGFCEAPCSNASKRCVGVLAQVCDSAGKWQDSGNCSWSSPAQIEPATYSAFIAIDVGVDSTGNAMAVWAAQPSSATRYSIQGNRYVVGAGWGTTQTIDRTNAGHSLETDVAVAQSGDAIVAWTQVDSGSTPSGGDHFPMSLLSRRFSSASGWNAAPLVLDSQPSSYQFMFPQLGFVGTDPIALWLQTASDSSASLPYHARSSRLISGSSWAAWDTLDADPGPGVQYLVPRIASNAAGDAFAIWGDWKGSVSNVVVRHHSAASGWGSPTEFESGGGAYEAAIAVDSIGDALALWIRASSANGNVLELWFSRYLVGQEWTVPQLLSSGTSQGNLSDLSVAMDSNGNAVATWMQTKLYNSIWAAQYVAGRGWSIPKPIGTGNADESSPRLTMDAHGRATVAWVEYSPTQTAADIWLNRFRAGAGWATPEPVRLAGARLAQTPIPVVDPLGRVTLIWVEAYGPTSSPIWEIWSTRFE